MSDIQPVYIVSGARTAIGSFGGSLKSISPCELGEQVVRAALKRSGVDARTIGHIVLGNVIHTEARDIYLSRVVAMNAGISQETPALTINRLCGSGLQAIISAAQMIMLNDISNAVAGGVESMSCAGHLMPQLRWGQRLGEGVAIDMMLAALNDPFGHGHMGITAENIAKRYGISREQQDRFAAESHRRAQAATEAGYFTEQIVPIQIKNKHQTIEFKEDEHVRKNVSTEDLANLRPAFKKSNGTVTAGNASGINDGAAAVVLMSADEIERQGCSPMGRIVGYAHAGVDPSEMGMGPVPAVQKLLQRTGLSIEDIDVIESNEAFAAQACAVNKMLDLPHEIVNPNGGAVALGHPIGSTGAIITLKLLYELKRTTKRYGIATMCIGGGQGIALAIERV